MYNFKPVKGDREETVFPVAHYSALITREDHPAVQEGLAEPGIVIQCTEPERTIRLPQDADAVYIMNDAGDTIQSYRWPMRQPHQQAQEVA